MSEREDRWADLLRRANRGDRAAYAQVLGEIAPVLRRVVQARSPGRAEEVEDVLQEVLLAVHAKRHTWRETEPVTPWLYAIARYKAADAGRRRRGGNSVPIDDLAEVLPDESFGEVMAGRDLGRMLAGIDDRSAGIVRALAVEGNSAAEVGARLGMTEGAVRVAYHRAMTRLKKLARDGTEPAAQKVAGTVPDERLE
ncbi:sigma-70 family RNA polymerase sigma factor [Frigidibacter sp. ROC022]|uniref:sigma-70 family RNA polymerase sigma factor n=1 Tax=Frigidibacter sp. ROC022 TaxID=2971796 RepID=UPI00215A2CD1|nr:sigma-70 family RNA polymerase sigma factor [Frigidibacter sp. ROC022]MCR8723048.1 sigma-70 family RNA polymerase sigma factor [Frigidibacter sp. ROC022]